MGTRVQKPEVAKAKLVYMICDKVYNRKFEGWDAYDLSILDREERQWLELVVRDCMLVCKLGELYPRIAPKVLEWHLSGERHCWDLPHMTEFERDRESERLKALARGNYGGRSSGAARLAR